MSARHEGRDTSIPPDVLEGAVLLAADKARVGVSLTIVGPPDRVVFINDAGVEILGHPREVVLATPPVELLVPEEQAPAIDRRDRRRQGEVISNTFLATTLRSDGRRAHLHVGLAPLSLEGRQAMLAFFVDVSDARFAEQALASSEARFRQLVEQAPEAVWMFDGKRFTYVNRALVDMLGYPSAEALLEALPVELIHPDDRPMLIARTARMLEDRLTLGPQEYRVFRHDGRTIVLEAQSIPLERDGTMCLLSFGRDVSARKEMEARLMQADRLATLGATVAGIAHEINNPLAFALLALEEAEKALGSATDVETVRLRLAESLADAREGTLRVAGIVRELRAFSRPPERKRERLNLGHVIAAAERFARNEIRHRAHFIKTFDDVRAVDAVPTRLEQVFVNLLVNAAHALPEGRSDANQIEVRLYDDGRDVVAEVRDNGVGIAAADLPRVFDPFFSTKASGMGVGLSICKDIVTSFGGTITAESELGAGTTFRVRLPAADSPAENRLTPPASITPPPLLRRRLLIVDDEKVVGRVLSRILDGYDAEHVVSAAEALERLREDRYDLVLCDLMMPGMTGMELHTAIERERPSIARRFVFMTGGAFGDEARAFLARTRCPTVEKPFATEALLATLDDVANRP